MMARELKTAGEIKAEIQRRLDERIGAVDYCVEAPTPTMLDEPDGSGCNWTFLSYSGDPVHDGALGAAVMEVKAIWNLKA